jgi:hypothetical protein
MRANRQRSKLAEGIQEGEKVKRFIMLCLAAMFDWFIGSLDYSQAYLNADVDEMLLTSP